MLRQASVLTVSTALALGLASAPATADYRGPLGGQTTVAQILSKPKDGMQVVLTGVIASKTGAKSYVFRDNTGEIAVEIKAKLFPAEPVDDKTRVEIAGEVEKDFRKPVEIDVETLRIVGAP
jgi:uncharacterized protein (TIGR00156 family)